MSFPLRSNGGLLPAQAGVDIDSVLGVAANHRERRVTRRGGNQARRDAIRIRGTVRGSIDAIEHQGLTVSPTHVAGKRQFQLLADSLDIDSFSRSAVSCPMSDEGLAGILGAGGEAAYADDDRYDDGYPGCTSDFVR